LSGGLSFAKKKKKTKHHVVDQIEPIIFLKVGLKMCPLAHFENLVGILFKLSFPTNIHFEK
jgi:hypothetical protein